MSIILNKDFYTYVDPVSSQGVTLTKEHANSYAVSLRAVVEAARAGRPASSLDALVLDGLVNALEGMQPQKPDGYELVMKDGRLVGIKCLRCERTSYNRGDIEHLYCAACNTYHK